MRTFFLLPALVFLMKMTIAQSPEKSILHFDSYAYNIAVTPDENFVVTTKAGEVAVANSIGDYWIKVNPIKGGESALGGVTIEQPNFFNKDTGFVSGFINYDSRYNIIYHTTDAGKHWQKIDFGQEGWIDNAINLDNGEAWLSIAGSGIAYTNDYGYTWKKLNIPERRQRFANIYFNEKHEGVIGSLWDMIAVTNDNCKNWKIIPTPLDQKKYNKTNSQSRPEINNVALYKDYIFCTQEDLVFYTKRDSIGWVWLPNYSNFYTDPQNSALYFKTSNNSFIKSGSDFNPVASSEKIDGITVAKCKNANLFIFSGNKISEFKADNSFISSFAYTNDPASIRPSAFAYEQEGIYGNIENKIYIQTVDEGKWKYFLTLPFSVDSGHLLMGENKNILFTENNDSIFYYNIASNKVTKKSKNRMITDFCSTGIKKIIFSKGSSGCFHSYSDDLVYTNENEEYKVEDKYSEGSTHTLDLPENEDTIDKDLVDDFIKKIPIIINKMATIDELGFTEKDYSKCKQDILEFQHSLNSKKKDKQTSFNFSRNNLDFPRLVSVVDSIKLIEPEKLNAILFNLNEIVSTTTSWVKIEMVNDKNEVLDITNNYYEPNAFYFPWIISFGGYTSINSSIEINHFLGKAYPSLIRNGDKVNVLHELVKRLY